MRKDRGTTRTSIELFHKTVMPEPNTGCWLWLGKTSECGYGRTMKKNIRIYSAHRLSYYLHNGDFDRSLSVLHKCDTPSCVNPDHLYLGTQAQNVKDRDDRNRRKPPIGELHGRSKINTDKALEIISMIRSGLTIKVISKNLNISKYIVSDISRKKTWSHLW